MTDELHPFPSDSRASVPPSPDGPQRLPASGVEPFRPLDQLPPSGPSLTFGQPSQSGQPGRPGTPVSTRPGPRPSGMPAGRADADLTARASTIVDADDLERGLASLDPLTVRPRISTRVLCIVIGLALPALAIGLWWLGVRTMTGQSYDETVVAGFNGSLPGWLTTLIMPLLSTGWFRWLPGMPDLSLVVSVVIGLVGLVVMIVRRRWWLIGQSVVIAVLCYAASLLKPALPRPFLINADTPNVNSAPSGHTILATAAGMVLLIAVPRVWRACCALIAALYSATVGLSVIAGGWHRPTDVVMAMLLVGGITLIVLAGTRASGMDDPGRRMSSVSVQIVGSVMVTAGLLAGAYAAYIIWQILPGLSLSAQWSASGAHLSTLVGVIGTALLVAGLTLVMRQLTASPLTRIGLIGAPPAPPSAPR